MYVENYAHCFFCDSTHVFILTVLMHFTIFIGRLSTFYFHLLINSTFLVTKGLLCLYDKQNKTWLLVDMEFFFSCLTRHLTRELSSWTLEENFHIYARLCIILYISFSCFSSFKPIPSFSSLKSEYWRTRRNI